MQAIAAFNDSRIGSNLALAAAAPTDLVRTGLACATAAEIAACHWVPQDKMAWVDPGQPGTNICNGGGGAVGRASQRVALGHVRDAGQLDSIKDMLDWVQRRSVRGGNPLVHLDVYLVGGFRQAEPANAIVKLLEGGIMGIGKWTGITAVYGHIKKPNAENTNQNDANGHIPAFVADVTVAPCAAYPIGTSDIAGCIAVLAVPAGATVVMKKVHIYDRYHTVVQGAAGLSRVQLDRIGFP